MAAPPTPTSRRRLDRTTDRSLADLQLSLSWHNRYARHNEHLFVPRCNLVHDILPPELQPEVLHQPIGHRAEHRFGAGELLPDYRDDDCLQLPADAFHSRYRGLHIKPRAGRYYPRALIAGVRDILPQDASPFRIGEADGDRLRVDLNPPLAGHELTLGVEIVGAWSVGEGPERPSGNVAERITAGGPGMQVRWRDRPTDFLRDTAFSRDAPQPDGEFYRRARLVDHLDRTATAQVEGLYRRLIAPGSFVLDLMSSWKSHLADDLPLAGVAGLGMNREELDANPRLDERSVVDLNLEPTLPYADGRFDAVVCTVSVEYLTGPLAIFAEVRRVLKADGLFILTFSNRWFPPKVINLWRGLHEFERPGLVLEYFLLCGGFTSLETRSIRGLPRPADDKYAGRLDDSDPVYAVWGRKRADA
jgi:SAM-dependent methyltransferase